MMWMNTIANAYECKPCEAVSKETVCWLCGKQAVARFITTQYSEGLLVDQLLTDPIDPEPPEEAA